MAQTVHSTIEARRDQMFPVLEPAEIERLARFGERISHWRWPATWTFTTGALALGAFIFFPCPACAESSQHRLDRTEPIVVTHGPGSLHG